jgi:sugar lactone lactonase YvrE
MAVVALDSRLNDLVDPDVQVDQIATGFVFTEGPLWNNRDRTLTFSDVRTGIMRRWHEKDGSVVVVREGAANGISNGNTWDKDGNMLTCEHDGRRVSRTLPDGSVETFVAKWGDARLNSPNDVITALNGDVVFTDPTYGLRQPDGSIVGQEYPFPGVFRYSLEKGTLQALVRDFDAPNGLALTADDSKMYICDTRQQIIRVFDVAPDGVLSNSRVFCEAKHGDASGRPDGMKLDSLGNVYLAANSPEGIWVFDPDGKLLGFIGVGESPANLAWGGDDWQTLYVTAQTSVYRLRMKVPGQPVRFAPR